jgi:hypothetical protein
MIAQRSQVGHFPSRPDAKSNETRDTQPGHPKERHLPLAASFIVVAVQSVWIRTVDAHLMANIGAIEVVPRGPRVRLNPAWREKEHYGYPDHREYPDARAGCRLVYSAGTRATVSQGGVGEGSALTSGLFKPVLLGSRYAAASKP